MPPSPVVVEVPTSVAPRPRASLAGADSAPKLMPAIVTGISSSRGFVAKRVPRTTSVSALLSVPLERIARDARAEEEQVVEVEALRTEAADVVDPPARHAGSRRWPCGRRGTTHAGSRGGSVPTATTSVGARVVDLEVVELPRGPVASELRRVGIDPGGVEQTSDLLDVLVTHLLLHAVRAEARNRPSHV